MISIWVKESFYRETDVLIAGGGLMGLWTAYELLRQNPALKVTICEALPVPALASTRNAGFACFGSPSEFWSDLQTMGENEMWKVVEMRYKGIQKIRSILGEKNIGFETLGGFELFNKNDEWNGSVLRDKLEILNKGFLEITGHEHVYSDRSNEMAALGLVGFAAMAGNSIEGGLHSGMLVNELIRVVCNAGAIYLTGHEVVEAVSTGTQARVLLRNRQVEQVSIICRALVWATNASLGEKHFSLPRIHPARGQILLSPPLENFHLKGTFHFDEGYYYFRNLCNRLLLGGARNMAFEHEETLSDQPTAEIRAHLEKFIAVHFPQVAPTLGDKGWLHWAGIMGITENKLPIVEKVGENQWVALACNGMGVALTPIVAEEVAELLSRSLL